MKNISVLTVLVIILSVYSYAEENERNYCFSYGPQFGFIYGQAQEYVYPVSGETKGELLSELLWDTKPVFYYGIHAEFSRADLMKGPGFFSSFSFKTGIPADSGVMEDRDWQSKENDALTDFSSHTNRTNEFFQIDVAVGVSFPIKSFLYLKPFIGVSWMHFIFNGRDGYGKYARKNGNNYYPIDDNPNIVSYKGKEVIQYEQDWLMLAAGFTTGTKIFYPFSFDFSFQISPITYCMATDHHYPNTVYKDFTSFGLFLEPSLKVSFAVKPAEFSLETGYRYIGKTKGESYKNSNNNGYISEKNKTGAGLSMWNFNFLVSFSL